MSKVVRNLISFPCYPLSNTLTVLDELTNYITPRLVCVTLGLFFSRHQPQYVHQAHTYTLVIHLGQLYHVITHKAPKLSKCPPSAVKLHQGVISVSAIYT